MKRPNYISNKVLNLISEIPNMTTRAFSIVLALTLICSNIQAQVLVDCNSIIACNEGVQISLDDDCVLTIEPNMVLRGQIYDNEFYDVSAKLPNGTSLPQFTAGFDEDDRPIRRVAINRSHIKLRLEIKVTLRGCSNSCWGYADIEDKLAPVIETCPCEERITEFDGTILGTGPTYARPQGSICDMPPGAGSFTTTDYIVFPFSTDVTGIVDVNMIQTNAMFNIYIGSFDPLSPCTNRVVGATNTRSFSGILSASSNYVLVVSAINDLPNGSNVVINSLTIDSQLGNIRTSTSSTVCILDCNGEVGLLAQTATNATNQPLFLDGCSGPMWIPTTSGFGTIDFGPTAIELNGGSNPAAPSTLAVTAQICFTSGVSQTQSISFDYTTQITNNALDPITFTVNNVATNVAVTSQTGSRVVNLPGNAVFCLRVQSNNRDEFSTLTISNVVITRPFPLLTYTKKDSVYSLPCSSRFGKVVQRQWQATDGSGNVSDKKTQFFYIRRATLADVVCPADWIRDCTQRFDTLPNGAPRPSVSGEPTNINCQNIQVYFDDIVFDQCGAGIKVSRQWNIIDWCTGEDKICPQVIKVEDVIKPVVTCPADITSQNGNPVNPAAVIRVTAEGCTANWDVLPPTAVFDCSSVTWEVRFKKADSQGNPPANAPFTTVDGGTRVVGNTPAFARTISQTARPYRITGLPLGRTWLKYTVIDACGNSTDCFTEIDVVDLTPPTAICEDEIVVSLDDTGWGAIFAEDVDEHSLDNCSAIVKYEVRRKTTTCAGYASDLNFSNNVKFCCTDVTSPETYVPIILRVYDASGNFNDCETLVKVQNKRPPVLTCPSNKTLTCGDARISAWVAGNVTFDTTFFGRPSFGGICGDQRFGSRIIANNLSVKCGTGTVDREWFLVNNPNVKCTQRLTVTSPPFSTASVTFPGTVSLATCDLSKATPEALNSRPIISNLSCRDIGVTFNDQLFYTTTEACIKILRTWRVIDWCTYPTNQVIAEQVQTIKLTGSGGATFSGCTNQTVNADPGKCEKEITLTANASDACTDDEDLKYTWSLDLGNNNSVDASGTTKSFTRTLPAGRHKVTFTVTNRCGTPTSCTYEVTVRSSKKPTPICRREVAWVIGSTGSTEVWASDFNLKSENNCGDDSRLKFAFNAAGTQASRTFTCADIPNGQVARIPLSMYVFDENGNFDYCDVILILQDSPLSNGCPDNPGLLPSVAGRIMTETSEGVDEIEVALTNMASASEIKDKTKNEGSYKFVGVDVFDPKTILAYKNDDVLNGVSTLDLVLIQRHIIGAQKITSPYKLLAADVNNSRSISASDLVNLRKLILGISSNFDNNTSWRFVPSEYIFEDPEYPYDFPSKINVDSIFEDKSNVNFIAIKVGDVNNSIVANARSQSIENRSSHALFVVDNTDFKPNTEYKYEIKASEDMDISGAQWALTFDTDKLQFDAVKSGLMSVISSNYNAQEASNGKLRFSIDLAQDIQAKEGDVLFTIVFNTLTTGDAESIKLDTDALHAEVYDANANVRPLHIQARHLENGGSENIVYQNEPNPFKEYTQISFELARANETIIRIMDVTGKVVFTQKRNLDKGYHTFNIQNHELSGAGVYFYQIESGGFSATKKMILIE